MTALLLPPKIGPTVAPQPHKWTCQEFHDMGDRGDFEGQSVILVDGEILDMPNPNPPHNGVVGIVDCKLREVFGPRYWVRVQSSFATALDTDPVPDLAVVTGSPRDYLRQDPTTAHLIVEVSDSSLSYDIGEKSNLYAAAGIADYWVIDVNTPQLFVFRDPIADATAPRGFRYNTILALTANDTLEPLAAATLPVSVRDLLP
jgi:Uma2 family endonuclease